MDDASVLEWAQQTSAQQPVATQELLREIAQVREQGYAMDIDNVIPGVSGIAVSIGTYRGAYAVAILTPSVRMHRHWESFRNELFTLRTSIEKMLGTPAAAL